MSRVPSRPSIYHITHVDNLAGIVAEGCLVSDRTMIERGGPTQPIGMSSIKRRRVEELAVPCHAGTRVGDYVPFYFCPRSVMLYLISRANHPGLTYRGGQGPIVHLEADATAVHDWTDDAGVRWAFSLSNAGAYYASFRRCWDQLDQLHWPSIAARDWRDQKVKESKQAEFLVHGTFPFELVDRIGVHSDGIAERVAAALAGSPHRPEVAVRPDWYY